MVQKRIKGQTMLQLHNLEKITDLYCLVSDKKRKSKQYQFQEIPFSLQN